MMEELKNTFSWSLSRDTVFRECARKYYFRYYGHWGGWDREKATERTRQLYVLGKLATRPMWIGQVVHECIATSLKNLSRGARVLDVREILDITRKRMRNDFRASRDKKYWTNPKKFCGLFEHEYEVDVTDEEWKEAAETVDRCLENFYASESYRTLQSTKSGDYLGVEELSSCPFEDVEMLVRLDCATRESDRIVIWDWKTGRRGGSPDMVQMACYAFFARSKFGVPLPHIVTRLHDLYHDKVYQQTIGASELNDILSYIRGSIKDMRSLLDDPADNTASEERFQKLNRESTCLRCNFFRVCEPDI